MPRLLTSNSNLRVSFQAGRYAWKYHRRLRIKLINAEGHETVVPQLVLNEVRIRITYPNLSFSPTLTQREWGTRAESMREQSQ